MGTVVQWASTRRDEEQVELLAQLDDLARVAAWLSRQIATQRNTARDLLAHKEPA